MRMADLQRIENEKASALDVVIGDAVVCASCVDGYWGWVLPGCEFTKDRNLAKTVAWKMDRLIVEGSA